MSRQNRIDQLCKMLQAEPNDLFLNYALGIEYTSVPEQFVMADAQFKTVIDLDAEHIPAYYQLGQLYEKWQRNPEALAFYKTGLELAKQKKNNKAINEFSEAIFLLED